MPEMIPVKSSLLSSIGYDEAKEELHVEFHNGNKYIYLDVPDPLWKGLMAASSTGQFFMRHIRGVFGYHKHGRS